MSECQEIMIHRKTNIYGITTNFAVDAILLINLVLLAATGLLLHVTLPPGSGRLTALGLTRHQWGDVHFYLAIVFLVITSLHLLLHWKWILCLLKDRYLQGRWSMGKLMMVIIIFAILLGIMLFPYLVTVDHSVEQNFSRRWHGGR
ncbi:MAG: DUF4405 domain-containing protein [Oligoflexia bacterium]|nr:DUF4405 domain-containing protein [Oligoflexia bacterium]MBF0367670.1 DUF4405 domain-containing protein [Oligoflexia bacterium]